MNNNHNILKLLKEILIEKKVLKENYASLEEVAEFLRYLNTTKEDFNSTYLLNYLYQNISSFEVAKRKTTARDFEDYLAILFSGKVTDETKRENKNVALETIENSFITNCTASNKREKSDILFNNGFELSVKTLMFNNKEINLGSFERMALFYELDVYDYLNERKGKETFVNGKPCKVGLGSTILLTNLLYLLKERGYYPQFKKRFLAMAKEIFADDMLIAIKNDLQMDLYFIKASSFYNLFANSIDNIEKFMVIVNRWEGNSIRVDREEFLKATTPIRLDFHFLEDSILQYFNEFEAKTTKLLVKYINDIDNKEYYKQKMYDEIKNIINQIEVKIKGEKQ